MTTDKLDIKLRPTEISDLDSLFQFQPTKKADTWLHLCQKTRQTKQRT